MASFLGHEQEYLCWTFQCFEYGLDQVDRIASELVRHAIPVDLMLLVNGLLDMTSTIRHVEVGPGELARVFGLWLTGLDSLMSSIFRIQLQPLPPDVYGSLRELYFCLSSCALQLGDVLHHI